MLKINLLRNVRKVNFKVDFKVDFKINFKISRVLTLF